MEMEIYLTMLFNLSLKVIAEMGTIAGFSCIKGVSVTEEKKNCLR